MAHEREVKSLLELPDVEQITDDLLGKICIFRINVKVLFDVWKALAMNIEQHTS